MENLISLQLLGLDQGIGGALYSTAMAKLLDESAAERCLTHAQAALQVNDQPALRGTRQCSAMRHQSGFVNSRLRKACHQPSKARRRGSKSVASSPR